MDRQIFIFLQTLVGGGGGGGDVYLRGEHVVPKGPGHQRMQLLIKIKNFISFIQNPKLSIIVFNYRKKNNVLIWKTNLQVGWLENIVIMNRKIIDFVFTFPG